VAGDQTTMPAQRGGGLHDQQHLRQPAPIQCLGYHGQDRPVRLGEPGPSHLALQHQDLVAQGQDLCVATIAADQQQTEPSHHQTHEPRQRRQHGRDRTGPIYSP